ncbi:MAG: hypothetical protein IEMM0002_0955 [bacterium]|nr:MAG: hypothetical protein IEMM0002_0955 [bacterium]
MESSKKKRLAIFGILFFAACTFTFVFYDDVLNRMAYMLVREDVIEPSDVIVVLAGDNRGERMMTGIDLYKNGYGGKIVFWGGPIYWKITYAEFLLRQLKESGVPLEAAIYSDEKLTEESTRGEALVNIRLMKENGVRSFILVTSPFHTQRAGSVYEPLAEENGMVFYVRPSMDSRVKLTEWWKDRHSAKMVYYEWSKRFFYWLT